jgi:hypothetical protein
MEIKERRGREGGEEGRKATLRNGTSHRRIQAGCIGERQRKQPRAKKQGKSQETEIRKPGAAPVVAPMACGGRMAAWRGANERIESNRIESRNLYVRGCGGSVVAYSMWAGDGPAWRVGLWAVGWGAGAGARVEWGEARRGRGVAGQGSVAEACWLAGLLAYWLAGWHCSV